MKLLVALLVALVGCYPPSPIDQGAGSDVGGQRIYAFGGAPASSQGGPRSGGGFAGAWTAGTYSSGQIVTRDPFLMAATTSTSIDPCITFNNVSDTALWQLNGTGAAVDPTNNTLTLNANTNGQSSSVIYKTNVAGWDHRRLIVDLKITGVADGVSFGILDGSLVSTTAPVSGMSGVTGFWGADIEIYSGGSPGYYSVHNGTQDPVPFSDSNGNITVAGVNYDRFYLDLVDNGVGAGTMTMTLYRNAYAYSGTLPTNAGWAIDVVRLGVWTVARPTFTNWKFAMGAHTGGSAATFMVKHAWARDTSGAWTAIGLLPTRD